MIVTVYDIHLLSSENQTLLCWGDTLLLLHALFDASDLVNIERHNKTMRHTDDNSGLRDYRHLWRKQATSKVDFTLSLGSISISIYSAYKHKVVPGVSNQVRSFEKNRP